MTNEQQEGTRIIAEFMGGIAKNNNYGIQGYMFDDFNKPDFSNWVLVDTAKYHTSFDWLMPVYVKFKSEIYMEEYTDDELNPAFDIVEFSLLCGNIDQFFNAIVELVKTYNELKSKATH